MESAGSVLTHRVKEAAAQKRGPDWLSGFPGAPPGMGRCGGGGE